MSRLPGRKPSATDGLDAWAQAPSAWEAEDQDAQEVLPVPDAAVQNYTVMCYAALVVIAFTLVRRGPGLFSLFPVLVGVLGVLFRWRITPPLLLFVLTSCLFANDVVHFVPSENGGNISPRRFDMTGWVISMAILGYIAAHYRLQALTRTIFPADSRRKSASKLGLIPATQEHRLPDTVPTNEIGWLALLLPILSLVAFLYWRSLPANVHAWGMTPIQWNIVAMLWSMGVILIVVAGLLRHLGHRRMTTRQARIFLQDAVWTELGGEQQRIEQFRSRASQRKGQP